MPMGRGGRVESVAYFVLSQMFRSHQETNMAVILILSSFDGFQGSCSWRLEMRDTYDLTEKLGTVSRPVRPLKRPAEIKPKDGNKSVFCYHFSKFRYPKR